MNMKFYFKIFDPRHRENKEIYLIISIYYFEKILRFQEYFFFLHYLEFL